MLRRLALILALLSPSAGLAQTAGAVTIVPAAFGVADCTSTTSFVTLVWTSSLAITTGDIYRVFVGTTSSCPTSGTPAGNQLGSDITATDPTQGFGRTLTRSEFITASGASCTPGGTSSTIYVCVQHISALATVRTTMNGSATLNLSPPPVPVSVTVAPGDASLFVSWADGTANGVAASSYDVTAVASSPANPGDTHTQSFTGKTNNRVTGLTNGVTYAVTVTAVAAGSNESAPSSPVYGTPAAVDGFWEQYKADGGREQGGCSGGPAGVLALLGAALALRGLRRRS